MLRGLRRRVRHASSLLWRGEVVPFKRCRFQACVVAIDGECDVADAVAAVTSIKKVSKATHPAMHAWQLHASGGASGSSDDGESGAGRVLLAQLQHSGSLALPGSGLLIAVTRWYGGRALGGARFRVIRRVARDALRDAAASTPG